MTISSTSWPASRRMKSSPEDGTAKTLSAALSNEPASSHPGPPRWTTEDQCILTLLLRRKRQTPFCPISETAPHRAHAPDWRLFVEKARQEGVSAVLFQHITKHRLEAMVPGEALENLSRRLPRQSETQPVDHRRAAGRADCVSGGRHPLYRSQRASPWRSRSIRTSPCGGCRMSIFWSRRRTLFATTDCSLLPRILLEDSSACRGHRQPGRVSGQSGIPEKRLSP